MDVYSKARDLGIDLEFVDGQGQRHRVSEERLRAILDGLPFPPQHPFLKQPVVIVANSGDCRVPMDAAADGIGWRLVERNVVLVRGHVAGTVINLPPSMAIGTYRLEIDDTDGNTIDSIPLLVTPAAAYQGSFDRVWVLSVQLYGLSSSRNWGIGDFTDLAALIELSADWGCAGIGLNPLHALFDDRPLECSPYAPNSRLFLNPLYIDPERLPNFPRGVAGAASRTTRSCPPRRADRLHRCRGIEIRRPPARVRGLQRRKCGRSSRIRGIQARARRIAAALCLLRSAETAIRSVAVVAMAGGVAPPR